PVPGFLQFAWWDTSDSSHYHALQTSMRKRLSSGLQLDVNYTYGSNISYGDADVVQNNARPQDNDNLRPEKGPAPYQVRHRMTSDFVYELPLSALSSPGTRAKRLVLGGWQIAGIFTAQTGLPIYLSQTSNVSARPDYVGGRVIRNDYEGTRLYLNVRLSRRFPQLG